MENPEATDKLALDAPATEAEEPLPAPVPELVSANDNTPVDELPATGTE